MIKTEGKKKEMKLSNFPISAAKDFSILFAIMGVY